MRLGLDQNAWVRECLSQSLDSWSWSKCLIFCALVLSPSRPSKLANPVCSSHEGNYELTESLQCLLLKFWSIDHYIQDHQHPLHPFTKKVTLINPHSTLLCAFTSANPLPMGTPWTISRQSWIPYYLKFSFSLRLHISVASLLLLM